jgi:hypothetical protein
MSSIMGQFCSDDCSEKWQEKNQSCKKCGNDLNLLEDQYTIKQNQVYCQSCGHDVL